MLKQRLLTAAILTGCFLGSLLLLPLLALEILIALVLLIATWEWGRMAGVRKPEARMAYVVAMVGLLYLVSQIPPRDHILVASLGLCWWLLALTMTLAYPRFANLWGRLAVLLPAGIFLIIPGWSALLYLGMQENYRSLILFCIALVAVADSGAYFTGRRFGKRKLAPVISPKKTIEGLAGGMLASAMLGTAVFYMTDLASSVSLPVVLSGSVLLALVSVAGDLFESMIKRQSGIKDSGNILPGHGGVLDRLDSITAALPVYVLLLAGAGLI